MEAAAATGEELELEVAAIICDLKRIIRARDRRRRRRMRRQQLAEAQEIPSWGRRRLRSVLEDGNNKPAPAAGVAERDGAASPDTPLAFPDGLVAEEEDDAAKKARAQDEWVQEQRGVVASLSQENADLLKQIEEYRTRLQSSRSANESLKQLHKVRQHREQEQARKMRMLALRQGTAAPVSNFRPVVLVLDLNEPAVAPDDGDEAATRARARAAADERFWQMQQRVALQKAASTAEARRRRLEILRAKVASPLVSCRTRRVAG